MRGTCIKFDRARGFGFILPTDDPTLPDCFVHFSDIEHTPAWRRRFLMPGMWVQFETESNEGRRNDGGIRRD
ncbi:MAG: cold shock domain-containing protein [Acidobacteriia bacterium]|nr:cold shock domain-containing protein [Terriglobia bacterium]